MYHVRSDQDRIQRSERKELRAMLRMGFRPMKQCRMMVKARAAMEKREAEVS